MPSSHRLQLAAALAILFSGCSSLQPIPMLPSHPVLIGGEGGISFETDRACRQYAYQIAAQTQQQNVNTEVASTLIGVIAGAVIGEALSNQGHHDAWGHHSWHHSGPRYDSDPDLAGTGAVLGGMTGAVLSEGARQDTQQTYDIAYDNCIAANWSGRE